VIVVRPAGTTGLQLEWRRDVATFAYAGRTRSGERISGECGAESVQEAVAGLRREQIVVTRIEAATAVRRKSAAARRHRAVKPRSLAAFTRQFAVMIDAGLPLVTCLELLGSGESDRGLAHAILQTRADVERGASLADAMKKHPAVFDPLYANMIAAGETGGILDTILERLAIYIEKAVKLRGQVAAALIYPIAVITIATIVVAVILWKVIPTFAELFTGLGAELPLPTRVVMALSEGLIGWLPWLVGPVFAGGFAFRRYAVTPSGRRVIDGGLLAMPVLGPLLRKIAVARFCRTLGTLIGSGVPILDGLDITASTCGNAVVEDALVATRRSIERGDTIAAPLRQTAVFPPMVVQMIGVGEATGALDTMLGKIADFYEEEVDAAVAGLVSLLEPVMVAFLGIVVGGIVIAMYLPMFDLIGKLAP
jgi:type IV pilus assembly protein PilC